MMAVKFLLAAALLAPLPAIAAPAPAAQLSAADRTAAFRAGGFRRVGAQWRLCDDPGTASYVPGTIESVADLNGDGLPEAIITESSGFCHGNTGQGFVLVSKQRGGAWRKMTEGSGLVTPLATRGIGGWPDLEIGGPGFCFPVHRWNGTAYFLQRHQYQGRRCRPGR